MGNKVEEEQENEVGEKWLRTRTKTKTRRRSRVGKQVFEMRVLRKEKTCFASV